MGYLLFGESLPHVAGSLSLVRILPYFEILTLEPDQFFGFGSLKPLVDIPRMADVAREMLRDSLHAFVQRDTAAAQQVALRADEVDALYNRVYRDLLGIMTADPTMVDRATHLLWAAHNLERIADRVTNICERVIFIVSGRMAGIKSGTDRGLET